MEATLLSLVEALCASAKTVQFCADQRRAMVLEDGFKNATIGSRGHAENQPSNGRVVRKVGDTLGIAVGSLASCPRRVHLSEAGRALPFQRAESLSRGRETLLLSTLTEPRAAPGRSRGISEAKVGRPRVRNPCWPAPSPRLPRDPRTELLRAFGQSSRLQPVVVSGTNSTFSVAEHDRLGRWDGR
jgi:hypothetical protein